MERYRNLEVFGERETLRSLIGRIQMLLSRDWWRDRQREAIWAPYGGSHFVFLRESRRKFPAIALILRVEARRLDVMNIVAEGRELCHSEYNAILCEFYLKFLHPAVLEFGLFARLSSDGLTLDELFARARTETLPASVDHVQIASPEVRRSKAPTQED